jgi:succinyl-CoA synthetase alpha subunit
MSILVGRHTRLLVQGLGREGAFHAGRCRAYGTNMVAGVHPGRGGTKFEDSVPVFESVREAVDATNPNAGILFVPAPAAADAIVEQVDAGVPLVICISEGLPVLDMVRVRAYMQGKKSRLVGPNCPGLISPGDKAKVGIMPGDIHRPGRIGVVSRSGTLTYEAVMQLSTLGIGQSTCVGIGGDPVNGTSFVDVLTMFENDPDTDAVVMIGEIGGTREQEAATFVKQMKKPVVATIVGQSAPPGKRMGHAGAIITGKAALASEKMAALKAAGAHVADTPAEIGAVTRAVIARGR